MAKEFSTGDVNARASAIKQAYANGIICLFSGTKPTTANDAEGSGLLLAKITLGGGAFTAGSSTNGLNLSDPIDGVLTIATGETWSGLGTAAASTGTTATWFRHYANAYITGASNTAVRWDGSIGASPNELVMANTTVVSGEALLINSFSRTVRHRA